MNRIIHAFETKMNNYKNEVEEGLIGLQTIQMMDMEVAHQVCDDTNKDVAGEIVARHFEVVEKMRVDEDETLTEHRSKLKHRLAQKYQQVMTPTMLKHNQTNL